MTNSRKIIITLALTLSLLLTSCAGGSTTTSNSTTKAEQQTFQSTTTVEEKATETVNEKVHIDQIGYRSKDKKEVFINGKGGKFEVIDEKSGDIVFTGEAANQIADVSSGDTVYYGDFSSLDKAGSYFIRVPSYGKSYTFKIADNIYKDVKNAMLKMLYFARCGMALEEKYAGQWKHGECHTIKSGVFEHEEIEKDGIGGWHDAGDYGRYTIPGATSAWYLMTAYELFPSAYKEDINIPESGNNIPDVLDECRYELNWMLKMQDNASGGVYHKLSTAGFAGNVMPDDDIGNMYFCPISATATGDFAAIMAKASRMYAQYDKAFADKCLKEAEKAWVWLKKNPNAPGFTNPPGVLTGEYPDENSSDERYWAAAELFRTTGKDEYHQYLKKVINEQPNLNKKGLGWQDVGFMGTIAYLFADEGKIDKATLDLLKQEVVAEADSDVQKSKKDGYRIPFGPDGYYWGSNMNVMNEAIHLIVANKISPKGEYVEAAQDLLHYLLGRNALDQCYVSGFGSKTIMNPHHRPSVADPAINPVPGMVAGGPNKNMEDSYARGQFKGVPAARCYADDPGAYSVNEVAIYWNASAHFVGAYFDSDK